MLKDAINQHYVKTDHLIPYLTGDVQNLEVQKPDVSEKLGATLDRFINKIILSYIENGLG